MPGMGSFSSMFYSWDVGPVHFVAVNTEAYYFLNYGLGPLVNQYEWLTRDLAEANRPENRSVIGFKIFVGFISSSFSFLTTVFFLFFRFRYFKAVTCTMVTG